MFYFGAKLALGNKNIVFFFLIDNNLVSYSFYQKWENHAHPCMHITLFYQLFQDIFDVFITFSQKSDAVFQSILLQHLQKTLSCSRIKHESCSSGNDVSTCVAHSGKSLRYSLSSLPASWLMVLDQGQTWLDRAFVVNDWYISGYLPIFDNKKYFMIFDLVHPNDVSDFNNA